MTKLWTEAYRPQTLNEYVWRDANQRAKVEKWISDGALPHLILGGIQGTGKTSLAKMVLKLLNIPTGDIMEINASRERDPDIVANKILNFCTTWALGDMKYVLLDEAQVMTPLAQRILLGMMEQYHESVRFIFTVNAANKIIPPIHSRCQSFHFDALDTTDFTVRLAEILYNENVVFEVEHLDVFVNMAYPDLRKCINLIQQSVVDGKLTVPQTKDAGGKDYLIEMVTLFQAGRFTDARKLVVAQAAPDEYTDIYRFLYKNLDIWGADEAKQNEALLIIRDGLVNHGLVADIEINLAATLCKLCMIFG